LWNMLYLTPLFSDGSKPDVSSGWQNTASL
jgi:hypothetical protein